MIAMLHFDTQENIPTDSETEYLESLLYNGFYAFEAITVRDRDDVICGICGLCPEVLLGDGNEKNCCRNGQVEYILVVSSLN